MLDLKIPRGDRGVMGPVSSLPLAWSGCEQGGDCWWAGQECKPDEPQGDALLAPDLMAGLVSYDDTPDLMVRLLIS